MEQLVDVISSLSFVQKRVSTSQQAGKAMTIPIPSSIAAGCIVMRKSGIIIEPALLAAMTTRTVLSAKSMNRRLIFARSTGELSAEAGVTREEEFESETASPLEAPKGLPSLISAVNIEKALRGIAITDADHYARLGLQRLCPYEEVTVAYKKKVEELMTSSNLEQEELNKQLELLKESHSILSSIEERRLYDWSLARMDKAGRLTSLRSLHKFLHLLLLRMKGRRGWWPTSC